MDYPRIDTGLEYLRLDLHPTDDGWRVRLVVHGELDSQTSQMLVSAVTELVTRPLLDRVVLDLGDLTFIDAAGVRSLLQCEAAAERNGVRLEPRDPTPAVVRILDIVGLTRHFGFGAPGEAQSDDDVDDLMTRALRVRRQAHDMCLRAQYALRTSSMLRDLNSARPTR